MRSCFRAPEVAGFRETPCGNHSRHGADAHSGRALTAPSDPGAGAVRGGVRRLGFAVKVIGEPDLPSHDARRWQSGPHLSVSLERLEAIVDYLDRIDVRMYRITSDLVPYATHPDLPQFRGQIETCADRLASIGARVRSLGIRLSSHPGQYVVLNSEREDVQQSAVRDLEVQAALFDAMGLDDEAVVVLHIGGMRDGVDAATARFESGLEQLSPAARSRLVIENDDRSFALAHVLAISQRTGLRVVWDILHHHCHDPERIPTREALELALGTWPAGSTPKIHYSSPRTNLDERIVREGRRVRRVPVVPQLRAHADLIDPIAFASFAAEARDTRPFDVMLEAKGKDVALLALRRQLEARGASFEAGCLTRLPQ